MLAIIVCPVRSIYSDYVVTGHGEGVKGGGVSVGSSVGSGGDVGPTEGLVGGSPPTSPASRVGVIVITMVIVGVGVGVKVGSGVGGRVAATATSISANTRDFLLRRSRLILPEVPRRPPSRTKSR